MTKDGETLLVAGYKVLKSISTTSGEVTDYGYIHDCRIRAMRINPKTGS